jgi:IPT/TIG domain
MNNPMIPNPDQLEHISPRNDPRTNPARYEEAPPDQLKPPVPTIPIGPNAVYLVDPGFWDEKLGEKPTEPTAPPAEAPAPVLSSIDPAELPIWAQNTEVFFNGSGFTEASKIIWNDGEEPTKFVSAEQLSTLVKPSTVQAPLPFTLEAYVVDQGKASSKLAFTFIT